MIDIRSFIGIDLNNDHKNYINELQQRLRKYAVRGRWKHSSNFHLTLKFLDDITMEQKNSIDASLINICAAHRPFRLNLSEIGVFQGRDSIRVLWLGLGGDIPMLRKLAAEIDDSIWSLGFPREKRRYTPHITIGQDIVFECPFEEIKNSFGSHSSGPIEVRTVNLFKSEQIENKRVYTKISDYALYE